MCDSNELSFRSVENRREDQSSRQLICPALLAEADAQRNGHRVGFFTGSKVVTAYLVVELDAPLLTIQKALPLVGRSHAGTTEFSAYAFPRYALRGLCIYLLGVGVSAQDLALRCR